MREITTTTTQRNQVTIPVEVRRLLGLRPRDKVAFTIEDDGTVSLAAASFSLESAFGSVKASAHPEAFGQIERDAKDAKAEATVREMREA
ncbi:MAG: type II toxin-antitoxin system PrlF family antitoxin [Chloroflexi bacterium]|nr:type II toxin-antitoxin system PrlF family antitoxin [Chloroflexota bacterium]